MLVGLVLAAVAAQPAAAPAVGDPSARPLPADGDARARCGTAAGATTTGSDGGANVSVTTLIAPRGSYDRLVNASALARAADRGVLVPATMDPAVEEPYWDDRPEVVTDDATVVTRIDLSGNATRLLDRMAARGRSSPEANFVGAVQQEGIEFVYTGHGNCPPDLDLVASAESGALRVVTDRANGTLFLVLDADRAVFVHGGGSSSHAMRFGRHRVRLEVTPRSGLVTHRVAAETDYHATEKQATFTEDGHSPGLALAAAPNRSVGGATTLPAGTDLAVTLRTGGEVVGNRTATVHVHPADQAVSRHYHADFDLSSDAAGTNLSVVVRANGTVVGETTGTVVDRPTAANVTLPRRVQVSDGEVVVREVTLSHSGFVRVTAGRGRHALGVSGYLPPGTHRDVVVNVTADPSGWYEAETGDTLEVWVHRDPDGDRTFDWMDWNRAAEDHLYVDDGYVVTDRARIVAATPTPSPTSTPTATPVSSPTPTPTGAPGFGVAVAVLALAATALVCRRR